MDYMVEIIGIIAVVSLIINIPLGLWRGSTKKFSIGWFASIHLAIPLVYFVRISFSLPSWTIPVFIGTSILGQQLGVMFYRKRKNLQVLDIESKEDGLASLVSKVFPWVNPYEAGGYKYRIFLVVAGLVSVVFGVIGVYLPLLPTAPFLLLATLAFIRVFKGIAMFKLSRKTKDPSLGSIRRE